MEKQNLALITEISAGGNTTHIVGVCEEGKIYTLTLNVEGNLSLDIRILDEDTSKILQKINPHSGFTTGSYAYKTFCSKSGLLNFDVRNNKLGKIYKINLQEV